MNWDGVLEYISSRLVEPSTWVSIGSAATGLGVIIAPDKWQAIMGIGMTLGGLLGVVLRERKKTSAAEIQNVVQAVVKPTAMEPAPPSPQKLEDIKVAGNGK